MSVLMVNVKVGESMSLSGEGIAKITLMAKSGQVSRFKIDADESIDIQLPERSSMRDVIGQGLNHNK
jgi:hypothetical protein